MSRLSISDVELFLTGFARHANPYRDSTTGTLYLSLPERLPHQERDDSKLHICKEGDTVYSLAVHYYRNSSESPVYLAAMIADFQDPPIVDRSIPLEPGRILSIPSLAYKREVLDGEPLTASPRM